MNAVNGLGQVVIVLTDDEINEFESDHTIRFIWGDAFSTSD